MIPMILVSKTKKCMLNSNVFPKSRDLADQCHSLGRLFGQFDMKMPTNCCCHCCRTDSQLTSQQSSVGRWKS